MLTDQKCTDPEYDALILFEVGGIQKYVFESNRLRDIRGASALLDEVNREMVPSLLGKEQFKSATLIRSIGGVSLIGIKEADADQRKALLDELEQQINGLFARHAPGVALYSGRSDGLRGSVDDELSQLTYQTSLKQGQQPEQDSQTALLSPMVHFCKSCGLRPVQHESRVIDSYELICRVCYTKHAHGQMAREGRLSLGPLGRFKGYVRDKAGWQEHLGAWREIIPDDLDAIGAHSNGEIGMILADGNRLGVLLRRMSSFANYQRFAKELGDEVQTAVFDVLENYKPQVNSAGQTCLPWEIILLGGDDVLIVTAAHIVFDVATAIMEGVEKRTASVINNANLLPFEGSSEDERTHIDMAAGVAVAPAHFPVIALHSLVGALEKKAKKKAYELKDKQVSTIDFHRITADGNTALEQARSTDLKPLRLSANEYQENEKRKPQSCGVNRKDRPESNVLLIGRPYTIAECNQVLEVARDWRKHGLPGSKVHLLYEALLESPAAVMFNWAKVVGRAKNDDAESWKKLELLTCTLNDCKKVGAAGNVAMPWIHLEKTETCIVQDEAGEEREAELIRNIRKTHLLDVIDMWSMLKDENRSKS